MGKCKLIGGLLGLCLLSFTSFTHAACRLLGESAPRVTIIPLPFTSISPRQSNSSTADIMTLNITQGTLTAVCDNDWYFAYRLEDTLAYTGQNTGNFPIYKTSVNGVGVYNYTYTTQGTASPKMAGGKSNSTSGSVPLLIAKMSNNTVSGVLRGASLPSLVTYVTESTTGTIDSNALKVESISFSGQTSYVVPTCNAEDKSVRLGQHSLSDFTDSNVTDWVDASIKMTCNVEFSNSYNAAYYNQHGAINTTIRPDNYYSVTVQAVNGFTNSNRGIMALDANGATGLGIQISRTQAEQSWSSLTWTDLNTPAVNTIKIPLYARYIKTGNTVTAGQANSKLIYTVQYK